jgi:hypothetical protein
MNPLKPALFLLSFSFCSLVNGTLSLKILSALALAHQMYPRITQFFLEAFARATARPHGYMVIDMKQNTPDILKLRTFIFPGEEHKAYVEPFYIYFLKCWHRLNEPSQSGFISLEFFLLQFS